MTKEEKMEMFSMRLEGYSLQRIGDRYGISRERVRQILSRATSPQTPKKGQCIYPNFRSWLEEQGISINGFSKMIGKEKPTRLYHVLSGRVFPKKNEIDEMLEATGMTYEEFFYQPEPRE